jgi:hypothetical protein
MCSLSWVFFNYFIEELCGGSGMLLMVNILMGTILNISQVFLYSNSITLSEGPVLEEEILFPFSRLCRLDYLEGEIIKFLFFKCFPLLLDELQKCAILIYFFLYTQC